MQEAIFEILKITIPSLIVFLTAFLVVRSYARKEYEVRKLEYGQSHQKDIIPLRLQAYERLSLFLERIAPNNLIQRVRQSEMNAQQLQIQLIASIRGEYEHNLSQQIYVSSQTWDSVVLVKDDITKTINIIATSMPPTASSLDLSRAILDYYIKSNDILPNQRALDILKAEVQKTFL